MHSSVSVGASIRKLRKEEEELMAKENCVNAAMVLSFFSWEVS